jgi:inositol phosphorylceramide synthase catalytic subunit
MLPEIEVQEKAIEPIEEISFIPPATSFYAASQFINCGILSLGYLILSYFLVGFNIDQIVLIMVFNTLYFFNQNTRRLALGLSIFIVYWIIFNYMKAFPNYNFNEVSIGSLYDLEKTLFGISTPSGVVIPSEYFLNFSNSTLDILSGIFYLCWIPVPLVFAIILFYRDRKSFFLFSLTFFLANIIGFIGYYIYPAAPPWYVMQNGFEFLSSTPGNMAGLGRFDQHLGFPLFEGIYSKSSNVFAAMPSLHAAYMLIVVYYGLRTGFGKYNLFFAIIMAGIWFTAVYSAHHYVIDVIAGIVTALVSIYLFRYFTFRTISGQKLLNWLLKITD